MAKHNETGLKGEQIAVNYLQKIGYNILCCNWRFGRKEVDCIAQKEEMVVFVEVKTRRSFDFGYPEEAVHPLKQKHLRQAARAFMEQYAPGSAPRFDIISIILTPDDQVKELVHIEDAFY
jgi:putative endonuclease